jgi:hypothetical protein
MLAQEREPVHLANAPDLIRNDGVGSSNLSCGINQINSLC